VDDFEDRAAFLATNNFGLPNLRRQAPASVHYRVCTSAPYPAQNSHTVGHCNWIGHVMLFGCGSPLRNDSRQRRTLPISQNEVLFSLCQFTFGGNLSLGAARRAMDQTPA
jgi:microcystin-dependent protein